MTVIPSRPTDQSTASLAGPTVPNLSVATAYARRGWWVFPLCFPTADGACGCGSGHQGRDVGKAPIGRLAPHGLESATTNTATVDRWWRTVPRANVGIALRPSALVLVDPDAPETDAEARRRGLDGAAVRASKNRAYLFKRPQGCPSVDVIKQDDAPLDVMAAGYVVAHGTHQTGAAVRLDPAARLRPAPRWVVDLLDRRARDRERRAAAADRTARQRSTHGGEGTGPPVRLHPRGQLRWRGELVVRTPAGKVDRDRSLFYLALDLAECNASATAIVAALAERDRSLGWQKFTGRADADRRYGEIATKAVARALELEHEHDGRDASGGLTVEPPEPRPPAPAPGAAACDGTCPTSEALRETVREYRAADELVLSGRFTPTTARVVGHLSRAARAARTNGTPKLALTRADVARVTLGDRANVKGVSRAFREIKAIQDDPALAGRVPWRLEWREGGRRTHVDLVPLTPETPISRADELKALGHLPRPIAAPKPVRERDDTCPRCHSPEGVESRSTKRCRNDACGHTWHTRPVVLGRARSGPTTPEPAQPLLLVGTLPGQNVPANSGLTRAGHFVPANTGAAHAVDAHDGITPHVSTDSPPHQDTCPAPPRPARWRCPHCRALEHDGDRCAGRGRRDGGA